jgi:hypothetical protein
MNLDQIHCDILQLKLQRAEIIIRKKHLIKFQQYEAVANERDSERLILKDLEMIEAQLRQLDTSMELNGDNLKKKQEIRNLLIEINPFDHTFAIDSLNQIEKQILDLKQARNVFLANQDQTSAEPLIFELNSLISLRREIKHFMIKR